MKRYLILFHLMAEFFWWQVHFFALFCNFLEQLYTTLMLFFCLISLCWFVKIGPVASEKAEDLWMFSEMKTSSLHCSRSLWFSPSSAFLISLSLSLFKTLASSEAQLINEANQFCQSVGPLSSSSQCSKIGKTQWNSFSPPNKLQKIAIWWDASGVRKIFKNVNFFSPKQTSFQLKFKKKYYIISPLLEHWTWTRGAFISSNYFCKRKATKIILLFIFW